MPETYVVPRSGKSPLRISGTLIKKIDGQPAGAKTHNRYHVVALYQLEDGRYVATISYVTTWQGEQGHDLAEVLYETPASVTQFFRTHNPTEHVLGFPPGEQFAEKQRRLLRDITSRYNAQVSELLNSDTFAEDANAESAPVFSAPNHHVPECGTPPLIKGDPARQYHGYYVNEYGEQFIFVYDYATREAWLFGGDIGWEKPRPIERGVAFSLVLSQKEIVWLRLCWETATGEKPMPAEEVMARVLESTS